MVKSVFLLIVLYYVAKHLCIKIKEIKIDNKYENSINYWMFTYDFKKEKKDSIFDRDSIKTINNKRKKNNLIVLLYITHIAIFIYVNYFVSQILIFILK